MYDIYCLTPTYVSTYLVLSCFVLDVLFRFVPSYLPPFKEGLLLTCL